MFGISLPFSRARRATLAAATVAATAALSLTGCSSTDSGTGAGDKTAKGDDAITIVTSTPMWADVANIVAESTDAKVEITSVINDPSVDPHHFEPTAAQLARAAEADTVVVVGGGYDAWLYDGLDAHGQIVSALPLTAGHNHGDHAEHGHDHGGHGAEAHSEEAHAEHAHDEHAHESEAAHSEEAHAEHGDHAGHDHNHGDHGEEAHSDLVIDGNQHVWYSPEAVNLVAKDIAAAINAADPEAKASASGVEEKTKALSARLEKLPKRTYAQTEPIADYILAQTPWEDHTPESYRATTLAEGEPAAADLARFLESIKAGDIEVLIYNPQTETDLTSRIRAAAEEATVPVVEIGETPLGGEGFFEYYDKVVTDLEKLA